MVGAGAKWIALSYTQLSWYALSVGRVLVSRVPTPGLILDDQALEHFHDSLFGAWQLTHNSQWVGVNKFKTLVALFSSAIVMVRCRASLAARR